MRFYSPAYFKPFEYLPPEIYNKYGDRGIIVMDPRILFTIDQLRKSTGKPITINTWKSGGQFSQRGFRTDLSVCAKASQHLFGRAADLDIAGITAEEFRSDVKNGKFEKELTYITRIEDEVSWIHIDCAAIPGTQILFFKP